MNFAGGSNIHSPRVVPSSQKHLCIVGYRELCCPGKVECRPNKPHFPKVGTASWFDDAMEGCRHSLVEISNLRGTHKVVFADAAKAQLRRYVLVSKAEIEARASLEEENFHWIFALEPGGGTSIVISIQSQYWVFASPCAYLTFGWLPADDPKLLRLPEGSAEFLAVTFEAGARWHSEDSVAFIPEVEEIPAALRGSYEEFYRAYSEIDGYQLSFESKGFKGSALTYGESHFKPILDILQRLEDILLDLGSGTGRVVLAAALACPFLKLCRGIEVLPLLHAAARDAEGHLGSALRAAPVELICGDLLEEDRR
eukprot:s125_g25.t1